MSTALLSLGSNVGDSRRYLADAVEALRPVLLAASSVYRTPPWGPVVQESFLNMAVLVADSAVDAAGWWQRAQQLEQAAHRTRVIRWGPRTLDVDVISVWRAPLGADHAGEDPAVPADPAAPAGPANTGDLRDPRRSADTEVVVSADPMLILPHPRAAERGFVLVPWAEIQPEAVLVGHGRIAELLDRLDVTGIVTVSPRADR